MSENVFRVTPEGKYIHNNEEISKNEFNARKAAADASMRQLRGADRTRMAPKDRAKSAFSELDEVEEKKYKKGGMVKKTIAKPSKAKVKAPVSVKPRSKTIKKR